MNTLVDFLRARLDEREKPLREIVRQLDAYAASDDETGMDGGWSLWGSFGGSINAAFKPREQLADVAAKRQLIELHMPIKDHGRFSEERPDSLGCEGCPEPHGMVCTTCRDYAGDHDDAPCETLKLLALPYADHPDYREDWRP